MTLVNVLMNNEQNIWCCIY